MFYVEMSRHVMSCVAVSSRQCSSAFPFKKLWQCITYVSLRLRVQNVVPAQPCVGKIRISLVLLNFLHCNFRLWFETP